VSGRQFAVVFRVHERAVVCVRDVRVGDFM
jgi:hypothetical protein